MTDRHILVVDDDSSIREVAHLALELVGGWKVTTASSGTEGWQLAVAERPDAILLDVMMPGMDGPTALRQLREHEETRELPVIFLTAKLGGFDNRFPGDGQPAGVISKPFDPMTLADEVAALLGWAR
ncbi:response regulator [Microlunatus parietis]|uniref:CheY-like chemotaxis protein n=1 Tax=Microlunatus parietis TaxID=682979 RepID=A0A7Y9LBG5_9ACTN|nr:response regulator [Microlunatus parietis]NYE70620.1 CheY-like chemotaxis protein [Microlunatus parietis]